MAPTAQPDLTVVPSSKPATVQNMDAPAPEEPQPGPPKRAPPKVFASPKKKQGATQAKPRLGRNQSIRSKLRKALAPYVASSYLKGEMARRFTKDYLEANPPPDNESDLPLYVKLHLRELNRVTEHWSGCMVHALDPMSHEIAVEARLQRLRDREEGRLPPDPPAAIKPQKEDDEDIFAGIEIDGGLTSQQLFGAVHLVSDVKVWQQILAAQQAEERRQHAIAEFHLNHAAKIIQRSWHSFVARKKEEQARLDALVSPDVQAMLSAAAYKAMRDARNKLAILKLRKSLSRKTRGFGSGMPRDLDPIPRPLPSDQSRKTLTTAGRDTVPSHPHSHSPPESRRAGARSQLSGTGSTTSGTSSDEDEDDSDDSSDDDGDSRTATAASQSRHGGAALSPSTSTSPAGRPISSANTLVKVKSFAARSAQVVQRLVSIKELLPVPEVPVRAAKAGRAAAAGRARPLGKERRQRKSEETEVAAAEGDEGKGEEETKEEGSNYEGEEDGEEEEDDDDSLPSASEHGEEESAEAAIAEAEEVVQMAAELAKAIYGDAASDGEGDDEEESELEDEVLNVLSVVEAAAEAATAEVSGGGSGGGGSGAAPGSLAAQALLAAERAAVARAAKAAAVRPRPPLHAATATAAAAPRTRGVHLTGDSAMIRQLIAGALAAAAAPVLGRKNALAMAQLGLGDLLLPLEAPAKAREARAKAAAERRLRPGPGAKRVEEASGAVRAGQPGHKVGQQHSQSALPLEIRAAAALSVGLPSTTAAGGPGGARRSDGGAGGRHHHRRNGDRPSPTRAFGTKPAVGWVHGKTSLPGDAVGGGGDRRGRNSIDAGGSGAVTVFLPSVASAYGSQPSNGIDAHLGQHRDQGRDVSSAVVGDGDPASSAAGRSSYGYAGHSNSGESVDGAVRLPSPRGSPTGVSAAAAAALATQPWAMRRLHHYIPPGAHCIGGSLPNPRGGGAPKDGAPREPTWLLPPIERINRSSTGPACLDGPGAAAAAAPSQHAAMMAAAVATAQGMARTASDPSLQRQCVGEQQPQRSSNFQGGGGGAGVVAATVAAAVTATIQRGVGPAAAAVAGGKGRRSNVVAGGGASMDALLQSLHSASGLPGVLSQSLDPSSPSGVQSGFVISSTQGSGSAAVARLKLGSDGQPPPLPSALAGGGGGAGGGTAAARQVVQHFSNMQRSVP